MSLPNFLFKFPSIQFSAGAALQQPSSPSFNSSELLKRVQEGKGKSQYLQAASFFEHFLLEEGVLELLEGQPLFKVPLEEGLVVSVHSHNELVAAFLIAQGNKASNVAFSRSNP